MTGLAQRRSLEVSPTDPGGRHLRFPKVDFRRVVSVICLLGSALLAGPGAVAADSRSKMGKFPWERAWYAHKDVWDNRLEGAYSLYVMGGLTVNAEYTEKAIDKASEVFRDMFVELGDEKVAKAMADATVMAFGLKWQNPEFFAAARERGYTAAGSMLEERARVKAEREARESAIKAWKQRHEDGQKAMKMGKLDEAVNNFQQALELAPGLGDEVPEPGVVGTHALLATCKETAAANPISQEPLSAADRIRWIEEAAAHYGAAGDGEGERRCKTTLRDRCAQLGEQLYKEGRISDAKQYLLKAKGIDEELAASRDTPHQ